jgi:hypothetical protein
MKGEENVMFFPHYCQMRRIKPVFLNVLLPIVINFLSWSVRSLSFEEHCMEWMEEII